MILNKISTPVAIPILKMLLNFIGDTQAVLMKMSLFPNGEHYLIWTMLVLDMHSKTAIVGVCQYSLVLTPSFLMGLLMRGAQYFCFKIKKRILKIYPL